MAASAARSIISRGAGPRCKGDMLYLFVLDWPKDGQLKVADGHARWNAHGSSPIRARTFRPNVASTA